MPAVPLAPNPLWRYSPPQPSRDGRVVWVDAMQLPMAVEHQAAIDEANAKRGGR